MDTPKGKLSVLMIEDSEDDALLLTQELKKSGYWVNTRRVDAELPLRMALKLEWDIVFCDYTMPKLGGMQALMVVREVDVDIPFIFVSGTIGEDTAVEAMRTGAQDYILKGNLKRLAPAVERELKESEHRRKRREAENRLNFLAHYDDLTGLPNRNHFLQLLEKVIDESAALSPPLGVAYIDLDGFKAANDSLGYEAGNLLLVQVADRLRRCVNSRGVIARLAADEFAILLSRLNDRDEFANVIDKVQGVLARAFDICGCKMYLGASIGLSIYPDDAVDAKSLVRNADITTFRVKQDGGNDFRFYNADMEVDLSERLELDHAIRQALPNGEFVLHYQPQIETATGEVVALEALVRWNRGREELVLPGEFIPLAEKTGFIVPLGEWVLRNACIQAVKWHAMGFKKLCMAVNLSARQLYQSSLVPFVENLLNEYGLEPACLELEITETAVIQDPRTALLSLTRLRELGVKVALDDFGTGYSSLSHLKDFMVDTLKIDRAFISGIPKNASTTAITAAVIAMSTKLGIRVVAEGVETQGQYQFLKDEGCEFVQGYFLGRPVPAEDVVLTG